MKTYYQFFIEGTGNSEMQKNGEHQCHVLSIQQAKGSCVKGINCQTHLMHDLTESKRVAPSTILASYGSDKYLHL